MPGAEHTACTVEMVNMQARVDVAVIDEIQMIGDESRWAAASGTGLGGLKTWCRGRRSAACAARRLLAPGCLEWRWWHKC